MNNLRHYFWQCGEFGHGRVAVRISDESIEIAQISGNAPPANLYFLVALVTEDEYAACENAHLRRINPWCIERRIGMSGAVDLRLRVLEDEAMGDAPIKNVLHISMNGKLNCGYKGWIGDFYAILENWPAALSESDKVEWQSWRENDCLREVKVFQPEGGWNYPGVEGVRDAFNISETLERLAAIDDIDTEIPNEYPADDDKVLVV